MGLISALRSPLRSPRVLIGLAALLAAVAAYTSYWFDLADRLTQGIDRWAEGARVLGYRVLYEPPVIHGFPFRLEIDLENAGLARIPLRGRDRDDWGWQAERMVIYVQPWNLNHFVFEVRGHQRLILGERAYGIDADRTLASARFADLALTHFSMDIQGIILTADGQTAPLQAERLQFHLRRNTLAPRLVDQGLGANKGADGPPRPPVTQAQGTDFQILLEQATLPEGMVKALGNRISLARLSGRLLPEPAVGDGKMTMDQILDSWRQSGGQIEVSDVTIEWPPLYIGALGDLQLDPQNRPEGTLVSRISGQIELVRQMEHLGQLTEQQSAITLAALSVLAGIQGNQDGRLQLPIRLQDGRLYLGPFAIAAFGPLM